MKLSTKLKTGDIIQLTQYSEVRGCNGHTATVQPDDSDNTVEYSGILDADYIKSADHYAETIEVSKTELEQVFKMNPRTVMTVTWYKKATQKTVVEKLKDLYANRGGKLISEDQYLREIKAIAKEVVVGDLRTARGRHELNYAGLGRMYFIDMDKEYSLSDTGWDNRTIQVDPDTLQQIIVNNKKYILK